MPRCAFCLLFTRLVFGSVGICWNADAIPGNDGNESCEWRCSWIKTVAFLAVSRREWRLNICIDSKVTCWPRQRQFEEIASEGWHGWKRAFCAETFCVPLSQMQVGKLWMTLWIFAAQSRLILASLHWWLMMSIWMFHPHWKWDCASNVALWPKVFENKAFGCVFTCFYQKDQQNMLITKIH